jgi:amino acid adenylation domain-containing protein
MSQEIVTAYRLSPQQKRQWLLRQSSVAARSQQCAILIEGALKRELLRQAVAQVVARHEILRTTFAPLPGVKVPVQVLSEDGTLSWLEVDLIGESHAGQHASLESHYEAERLHPFDFEKETPARVSLLALDANRHVLTLALPSLCADAQTLDNLLPEIVRCYEAGSNGDYLDAEEIVQYKQFSEWQNELLESAEDEAATEFWRTLEAKAVPAPPLPWEKTPREVTRSEPAIITHELQTEVATQVAAVARRHAVSTEVVLLACWQTLLWMLTKQEFIPTHVLCHGRVYDEMSEALGAYEKWPFIQTHCEANFHFTDILGQVNESIAQAREWQEYYSPEQSFVAGEDGSASVQEILPYGFVSESRPASLNIAGVKFSICQKHSGTERFRLKLSSLLDVERPSLAFHYDPAFYTNETVERLAAYYRTILRSVLTDQRVKLGSLELLDEEERRLLLHEWNDTRGAYPHEQCLHELFAAQAARTPDALAVVYQDEQLTFRELDERANCLAHHLRRYGVREDVPVVLLMERSVELIVGLLGILKAGGAFVPLDPAHPSQRLSSMIEDTGAPVVLTQERLLKSVPGDGAQAICIDTEWAEISRGGAQAAPPNGVTSEHLAYIIYTSGSTGRAKGVAVTHRSVVNLSGALRESVYAGQPAPLRVAVNASLSFDSSIKQVVQLLEGHALYLVPEEVRPDGEALLAFVREHQLDVLDCTPSQLNLLLTAGLIEPDASALKLVLVGGEALNAATWKQLAGQAEIEFYNVYGPTECTVDTTVYRITGEPGQPSIGRPIRNMRTYILDEEQRPVPMGVSGELYVGGAGVARGYLNRAELTADRFVPDALSGEAGARLYRTGDVARYLADGRIELLGRADGQVKVRGFRIELGEIEAVLGGHPAVQDAVVMLREDVSENRRLVGYVVATVEPLPSESEWRSFLKQKLPDYMIPETFMTLEEMPLTPNGKVDRRALPAPQDERQGSGMVYVAPRTPVEEVLCKIWEEVLGVASVGAEDNFFEIGGHSLLAARMISQARQAFSVGLSLKAIFESPTVEELAAVIEEELASAELSDLTPEHSPGDGR